MSQSLLENYATHEMRYQARKCISNEIRDQFQDADPMVKGIIVMLGTIIAMTAFNAMVSGKGSGRIR